MKQYLDIVDHVLENGKEKRPVRKNEQTGEWEPVDGGVLTIACPNVLFSHNMSDGFPLLTTKKMAWKAIRVELEGFIKGITDKRWFQDRGCKIWNEWSNPELAQRITEQEFAENYLKADPLYEGPIPLEFKKEIQAGLNDLGPIYGYQWRQFNKSYTMYSGVDPDIESYPIENHEGYSQQADQLKNIVDTLQNNPMDRRMVCSAWNPNQMHMMALPPCHWGWNVTVIGDELNLFWVQRSCDLMLGVPFNIASYGLLLCLLAEAGGFKRGNLSGMLVDCHIYENQIDGAMRQIVRDPQPLPNLIIDKKQCWPGPERFDIFNWEWNDAIIKGYNPLAKIDFGKATV